MGLRHAGVPANCCLPSKSFIRAKGSLALLQCSALFSWNRLLIRRCPFVWEIHALTQGCWDAVQTSKITIDRKKKKKKKGLFIKASWALMAGFHWQTDRHWLAAAEGTCASSAFKQLTSPFILFCALSHRLFWNPNPSFDKPGLDARYSSDKRARRSLPSRNVSLVRSDVAASSRASEQRFSIWERHTPGGIPSEDVGVGLF